MIYFVGAGPGAPDLITVRGKKLLEEADVVVYAGSLVNPVLLDYTKQGCSCHDSASLTLEEVMVLLQKAADSGKTAVRLHTGDPSLFGAIREQMDLLDRAGIPYEVVPGVSSFSAAAAALCAEYTLPGVSQTLILTRAQGRTPVPEKEEISKLAAHRASMAIFLSAGLLGSLSQSLLAGGYPPDTPAAIVYKASWPEEKIVPTTVEKLAEAATKAKVVKTALILVGNFLGSDFERSRLYHPDFTHEYREGRNA